MRRAASVSGRYAGTLAGRGACVQSNRAFDCSSTLRRAQVNCVAVLSNGRVVSGSGDWTLKVWDVSSGECLRTLTGHTRGARRRRPVEPRVDRSSTPRRAQVVCVAVLSNGHVVSGSSDDTLKVWDPSTGDCLGTLSGHYGSVRRRRPVAPRGRSLVDAVRGAGLVRRRPAERPRRVRVGGPHAQGVGPVERSVPPDADRAHAHSAAPASSRHNASIARRRRDGRRSTASPSCRTATSCPGRTTARSRCGRMSRRRWRVWLPGAVYLK